MKHLPTQSGGTGMSHLHDDESPRKSSRNMSMSMMVDYEQSVYIPQKKNEAVLKNIQNRTRTKWVANRDTPNCMQCNKFFGYITRYHHCYKDGGVYCDSCTSKRIIIPPYINIPTPDGLPSKIDRTIPLRVCDKCYITLAQLKRLETLNEVFQICELDIYEFKRLGAVCKTWHQLSTFNLSRFREIQYKLPHDLYEEWEVWALWTNRNHFPGHDVWMTHLIRSLKTHQRTVLTIKSRITNIDAEIERLLGLHQQLLNTHKSTKKCLELMCTRTCAPFFTPQSALGLLDVDFRNRVVRQIAIDAFSKIDKVEFECYLPYIIHKIVYNDSRDFGIILDPLLVNFIFDKCDENIRYANLVYWQLSIGKHSKQSHIFSKCDTLLKQLSTRLSVPVKAVLSNITEYVSTIETYYSPNDPIDIIKELHTLKTTTSPTHPEKGIWKIESGAISMKTSITKPISIPLTNDTEQLNNCKQLTELWKKEDVRKDWIVVSIIRLMDLILKRDLGIDLNIVTYNVQPTSPDSGFIEMVLNCTTLYNIEEYSKLTLLNYIIECNPNISTAVIRQRFINSCAAYTVFTKLLGIGDRHLENIMMTNNGELFHIDYGFILGRDPKDKYISLSEMRITDEMMDAIGGVHSVSYKQFKDLCSEIYNTLRRYTNTFEYMLMLLVETEPKVCGEWLTRDRLYQQIAKQFEPNSTYKEAEIRIYSGIDNSTSVKSGYKWGLVDFLHRHNKESTVKNMVTSTLTIGAESTKNFLIGVWDYLITGEQ